MNASVRRQNAAGDVADQIIPSESWTIGRLLREKYPEAGLRRRFQNDPYLDQVTLGQVLQDPFALSDFLMMCRRLPQCGDASVDLLRRILESAARNVETRH